MEDSSGPYYIHAQSSIATLPKHLWYHHCWWILRESKL